MKIPVSPPPLAELLREVGPEEFSRLLSTPVGPEVNGVYEHWDHLRHLQPPEGMSLRAWWMRIKLARSQLYRLLPLTDKYGRPIRIGLTDYMLRVAHYLDREAAGSIKGLDTANPGDQQRYLLRSLVEEAMTSSQLEGASTTRPVAKEMLATGRKPRDRSEQMIYNNFRAMQQLADWREKPLTPDAVFEMHRVLTADAIDDPTAAGRFRRSDEPIEVVDHDGGNVLHRPPPTSELPDRMARLCAFANESNDGSTAFVHPVIRAIALHFQLGYDHPFVDGNGRTARALFYWSMLRSGYWMTEYLSISSALKRAPGQYNRAYLYTETDESDLGYFVCHQLSTLEKAVEGFRDYVARKARDQKMSEALLSPGSRLGAILNHRQRELLLHALRNPDNIYRIAEHQNSQQIAYQTARSDLLGLVAAGLMTHGSAKKSFIFTPVADLAERLKAG